MHNMEKLKKMIEKELDALSLEDKLSLSTLEKMHKLTDTLKNIDKIEMLEEGGGYSEAMYSREYYDRSGRGNYSRDGEWIAKGTYDGGSSYANRGEHYVRGHYSRDDYSNAYGDMRGRYSRDESKETMMRKFDIMLGEAKTASEREAIKKCMEAYENI